MARVSALSARLLALGLTALVLLTIVLVSQANQQHKIAAALPPTLPLSTVSTNTPVSMLRAPFPPPPLPTNTATVPAATEITREAVPTGPEAVDTPTPTVDSARYVIKKGDTLQSIASHYGLAVKTLQQANAISDPRRLQVGDEIIIPLDREHGTSNPGAGPTPLAANTRYSASLALEGLPPSVHVVAAGSAIDQPCWRLISARWVPPDQALGRHHIYVTLLDTEGNRVFGQSIIVRWANGWTSIRTEKEKPQGEDANFPQYAVLGSYSVEVGDSSSDKIIGLGLGTPENPGLAEHTCWYLAFQLER